MWNKGLNKGSFGYMKNYKRRTLILSLIFFAFSLSAFLVGYYTTGTRKNYLSIVAAVGVLPAAKFFVFFIMSLRFKKLGREEYDRLKRVSEHQLYDLFYTGQTLNIQVNACRFLHNELLIYTKDGKLDTSAAINLLSEDLKKDLGLSKIRIFIFHSLESYMERIREKEGCFFELGEYLIHSSL